ncbi:mechanosensitive ion channel [Dyadobacter sp. CY107]|uniref:mechanosensitive ion channel family protein n=1 Tax=Dyadobacter fanqingshengii TaxID=2906443 RepID=UPI001F32961A|nr:mechanosensitive ion channel domain-containing protein [Dyadobacter fanqingshengii]MCF2504851.1 mechanosensitive ion channel [Dyadobacter fanqingshengii]
MTKSKFFSTFLIIILLSLRIAAQDTTQKNTRAIVIPDTLLFRIEKAQAVITQINAANKKGYDSDVIQKELVGVKRNVDQIQAAVSVENAIPGNKDLQNYKLMLTDVQQRTDQWRKTLGKHNSELQFLSEQVIAFSRDSLLAINAGDSSQKQLYSSQISDLKQRLQQAGQTTTTNLDTVSNLLAEVSEVYFRANDLETTINDYIKESGRNLLGKESSYIWKASEGNGNARLNDIIKVSYTGQNKILRYFFQSTWDNRVLLLLLSAGFFMWIFVNFRLAKGAAISKDIGPLEFKYINPRPILATFIFLFNITPLFEPRSPSIYIELNQFLLLVTMTIFFMKRLPGKQLLWWFSVLTLYVLTIISNILVSESLLSRLSLIALNLGSIAFGIWFFRKLREVKMEEKFIKPVVIIYIILNVLAVVLNTLGRISLAKSFNVTAISGLIQVLSLGIFLHVVLEAFELHTKVSIASKRLFSRINIEKSRVSFKKLISFLSVLLWLLVFCINLNIVDPIFGFLLQVLEKPRTFGSITFTLGNVLFFSVIIWLANNLQKHVGLLFSGPDVNFTTETVHKGSKLALVRLIIIVLGFLFAVTASGVPLDKISVLLGALGVGIGLGMQNIVNNFVSGIILIFEKPFTIGDYIELADKKGKVLDIGIRSSRMLTPHGSKVIIPNGDLLSGRLVNYTTNNARLKSEVTFKISSEADLEQVKKIINEIVDKAEGVVKKAPRQVLFNAITGDSIELKVMVWLNSVYSETTFKSYVLEQILVRFKASEIKVM